MAEHRYEKEDLINRFDSIISKNLGEIDNKGIFEHVRDFPSQKGVAGTIIEQSVLGYDPDTDQAPDLIVIESGEETKTELKTTGIVISETPKKHFVAKEPMSITAVGIFDIADQEFFNSHFWSKIEHLLLVYYHYTENHPVPPYDYRNFPIKGYEFHQFEETEVEALKQDWQYVHDLIQHVVENNPGVRDYQWKERVKKEYLDVRGELRSVLTLLDLAPKFPPRFRLKKPVVSSIVSKHFGYELEQLPGRYSVMSDVDKKCREITEKYAGKTIGEIAKEYNIPIATEEGIDRKGVAEQIIIALFGGNSKKLNEIELFSKFGLVAKSITLTSTGGKTEDMKLFHADFTEITREEIADEEGNFRAIEFEDSELYAYFADHEFLCILFEEPDKRISHDSEGRLIYPTNSLSCNKFVGFKRLAFSDEFINSTVKKLWEDTRSKIFNQTLIDVIQKKKDGTVKRIGSGEVSSAPNFLKNSENDVFMRGSGTRSTSCYKTENVNGIRMLPQYVWLNGSAVIRELDKTSLL